MVGVLMDTAEDAYWVGSMDMDSGFCSRSGTPNIHTSNNSLASQCMDNNTKYEDNNMDSDSQVSSNNTDEIPALKLSPILGDSNSDTSITTSIKRDYNRSFTYDNHKTNQENNYQFRRYHNHYNYNGHQPRYHNAHHNGHYRHYNNRRHFQGQHHEFYHHHSNGYNHFHQSQQHHLTHGGMPNSMSTSTPSSGQPSNPLTSPEMDENLHPNILAARKTAPWPNSSGDHNNISIGLPNTINKPYYTQQSSNTSDTINSINFGNDNSANVNNASCGDIQSTTTTTNGTTNGTSANLELQNSSSNNITQDKYPPKFNQDNNQFYYKKIHNYTNGYMPRFPNNYRHYGGNKYGKHYHNDYYHHHNQHYHHTNNHSLNIIHGPPHTPSPTNGQAVVSSTVRDIDDNNLYPALMSSKREEGTTWNSTDSADSTQPTQPTIVSNPPASKTNFPNNRASNGTSNESTTLHNGGTSVTTQNDSVVNSRNLTRTELKLLNNVYCRDREIFELNRSSNTNGSSLSNPTIGLPINTTNPLHTYQSYPGFFSVNNGVVGLRNGNGGNLYSQNCQNLHMCEGICDKIESSSSSDWSEENSESNYNCSIRSVSPGGSSLGKEGNLINPKERFSNGPIVQNRYSSAYGRNKKPYNLQLVPFDPSDIDPEERVKSFKFGEVTETPACLIQHNEWDTLSEAIWDKFVTNQQTTETFRKKMELWRDVMDAVSKMTVKEPRVGKDFPNYGLQVVGSTMSGFGSNTSDVDICMLTSRFEVDQRFEAVDRLSETLQSFRSASLVGRAEIIYAKVPILKFRDANKGLEVDLNCNNVVGIRNTHLLYCYSQLDWRVKPLVLVVKLWAQLQGINDAKNMTVSSYSLVLMVIHYLQCGCAEPVLPCLQNMYPEKFSPSIDIVRVKINDTVAKWDSRNIESLGELLVGFLEYYSHKFDYTRNAVSIRVGSTVPIKSCMHSRSLKNDPHQWKYLCVEEPFDLTNTARSVYDKDAFDKIRGVFYTSWQRILVSRDLESIFLLIPENEARSLASRIR